jgi:hypothetical protein
MTTFNDSDLSIANAWLDPEARSSISLQSLINPFL